MGNRLENSLYLEDVKSTATANLPWDKLQDKSIFITGASGLIGTFLIDVLMYHNYYHNRNIRIYACCRNLQKALQRFSYYKGKEGYPEIEIITQDVNKPIEFWNEDHIDYVLHLASNTHPVQYAKEPIKTIMNNIFGTKNMLDFCTQKNAKRFLFASSNEIYGENRGDTEFFDESYLGYIDCNTLRAGYPEGKRCGETLCQAYRKEKNLDVVIARLTRTIGPTVLSSDTKASSQFLTKALNKEDIVLKSNGEQYYSYCYVADTVSGLLTVLLKGENGEAYNVADKEGDIRLKDFSKTAAEYAGTKVIFELPEEDEKAGFSKATKARLSGEKIKGLGWQMKYPIAEGISRTLQIMESF